VNGNSFDRVTKTDHGSPITDHIDFTMKTLLTLALPIYALDQATKWWIISASEGVVGWEHVVVPDFFSICYAQNTGAAFSILRDNNTFFIIISLLALAGIAIAVKRAAFPDTLSRTAVGLLTGGILGNLTDRILHGHVVDFLLFDLHVRFANPWPVFNIADSAICVAVALFLTASVRAQPAGK
jgi:signal peptidase II